MDEHTVEIARALKEARQAAGMSQRALAALVKLPQSHISKIETGAVDAQISTIVEIARVLGFDLRLVPRQGLAAVDSLVRQFTPADALSSQARHLAQKLESQSAPFDQIETSTRARAIDALRSFGLLKLSSNDGNELRHLFKRLDMAGSLSSAKVNIEQSLRKLIELRNRSVHGTPHPTRDTKPAYTLEEDDDA